MASPANAFGSVFLFEAALFVLAAAMAAKTIEHKPIAQNLVPGE
jgi:BCD family chlorophyll transporter-like MFS transporter